MNHKIEVQGIFETLIVISHETTWRNFVEDPWSWYHWREDKKVKLHCYRWYSVTELQYDWISGPQPSNEKIRSRRGHNQIVKQITQWTATFIRISSVWIFFHPELCQTPLRRALLKFKMFELPKCDDLKVHESSIIRMLINLIMYSWDEHRWATTKRLFRLLTV